jgi:thiamine biosynthesis lipoprotein
VNERRFEAMGCAVVVGGASGPEFDAIARLFDARDASFSRFRPDSELVRVNAASEAAVVVSPRFAAAVGAALWAARTTGGLVDPTLGAALEAAGYDRDFAAIVADPRPVAPVPRRSWEEIRVVGRLLHRPPGTALDLNGVVKSMAVDAAAALMAGPGFVAAGGDIAVRGSPVNVALPGGGAVLLASGAIATSGTATRRWVRGGNLQHHLIDPGSGRPSSSPWTHVTAVGRDCLSADVAAKAGFLLGERGPAWLDARGVAARFVAGARVVENARWAGSLVGEAA